MAHRSRNTRRNRATLNRRLGVEKPPGPWPGRTGSGGRYCSLGIDLRSCSERNPLGFAAPLSDAAFRGRGRGPLRDLRQRNLETAERNLAMALAWSRRRTSPVYGLCVSDGGIEVHERVEIRISN